MPSISARCARAIGAQVDQSSPKSLPPKPLFATGSAASEAIDASALVWAGITSQLVVKYNQNALRAARAFAGVLWAMESAARATESEYPAKHASAELAAHSAAGEMVNHFYPLEPVNRWRAVAAGHANSAANRLTEVEQARAWEAGQRAAKSTITRLLAEGSDLPATTAEPPSREFAWHGAWPLVKVRALEPQAGGWPLWLASVSVAQRIPPAPVPGSLQHREAAKEAEQVAHSLTPAQRQIAQFWHLDQGSVTPAGVWLSRVGLLPLPAAGAARDRLRLLAFTSVAMRDALVLAWQIKYRDWSERPISTIRRDQDPAFTPLLVTPPFPAYVSGHAAVSAAAAVTVACLVPVHAETAAQWAEEAALSRLFGGIHFRFDNDQGLALGRSVGADICVAAGATLPRSLAPQ